MASRRQREFDRKYSSYRKYTATEDVNYSSHVTRSSYRSESITHRSGDRGRSSSSEIISGSETRSLPVYIAIQDYTPDEGHTESVALEQGQIVEVLDKKNAESWLIKTKARPSKTGWVPGSYFESPAEYYKQRRRTREIEGSDLNLSEEQQAILKRDQVYHDLLRSEEGFVAELGHVVDNYIKVLDTAELPEAVDKIRSELAMNVKELCNFHSHVMLKGLQYYSDDPGKVGQTFVRLERDLELHVQFHTQLPKVLELLQETPVQQFFQDLSNKVEAGAKSYEDYLKTIAERIVQYQNYFKEFIKYSARAKLSTKSMQRALELTQSVPQRAKDTDLIDSIENYPGDKLKLGKIFRHDLFLVWEGEQGPEERDVFLFKNKVMLTEYDNKSDPPKRKHTVTIRLDRYTVSTFPEHADTLVFKPNEPGLPDFRIRAKDIAQMEIVRQAWLKNIQEMKEQQTADQDLTETETTAPETEMNISDVRSEFSEYSSVSRKSSMFTGPEEGPPRKKVKSPPVISPTGSSTSLYSGGSSSVDWTTTGTTLEMQGTRVTRTQYGFRTLQESSAKMCLKVTGYPLPVITWYKDDHLLQEDNRHTFYADEDGFFALTIDPVQVEDTGRYTCMATNEYGQASTSAFFKVIKVEKEAAPPAFVNTLKDQEVKEGEVACFECEVEGWPEPELMWLVDDQPLRPSHDFKLDYDGQNARLEIRDAQPEDTGTYTIRIKNEYGSAESNAKLVVEPDPDRNHVAPEFQTQLEDVECNEGDDVRFKTVLTGDPVPEVSWLVNGNPLSESDKIKFICEDGICILTIKNVTRHFGGIVSCMGVNRLGSQICEGHLKVRIPPFPPQFDRPLEDRFVQEGAQIIYDIDVSGYPEPTLSFFFKRKQIVSGEDGVEIINRGEGIYRIEIAAADIKKHDGEFACIAVNEHGQAETRARVVVESVDEESRSAPTFVKDIEDQKVKYGETATFETSVRGNPKPEVSWYINGYRVDDSVPGVQIETTDMNHKILIDSSQYAGTVLCRAENIVGRYETKAKLIILNSEKQKKKPVIKENLKDESVVEGSAATFEVEIDAEPQATYRWLINDIVVEESENIHIREFDGSCKLELVNIALNQAGTVKFVAENCEGSCESMAKLTVTKKPYSPKFDLKPKNVTVVRGSEAVFEAKAEAIPEPTYTWAIDGRKIRLTTTGARTELIGGVSVLKLQTDIWSSGTVTVTAENSMGCDEAGAKLTVEEESSNKTETFKTETHETSEFHEQTTIETSTEHQSTADHNIKIKRSIYDQHVKTGETAQFEAAFENVESVEWYNNGKLLSNDMPGVRVTNESYESRLNIDSSQYAGTITVRAKNGTEVAEISANLVVDDEKSAPQMKKTLESINLSVGETLRMEVTADKESKFEWLLNGKSMKDMSDVTITNEKTVSRMEIKDVQVKHSGTVTVTAANDTGETTSSSYVSVTERKEPAKITKGPESITVKESEEARFSVEFSGFPIPDANWTINSKSLEESNCSVELVTENYKSSIKIEKCSLKQSGEIAVTAENVYGKDTKTAMLKVLGNENTPTFVTELIDRTVDEGEPLRWDVKLARPFAGTTVTWYLNNQELVNSEEIQIVDHGDGQHHITISEATTSLKGTLSCKATNSYGTTESKALITVKEVDRKPVIKKKIYDHDTEEGESVKFSAVISGRPTPKVSWFLNNEEAIASDEIRIKFDESTGKASIKILNPVESQSGTVTIRASNALGETEASAKLVVEKKKEPPKFLAAMDSRQINEGETAKFAVTVEGTPKPEVQWFLNGEPIIPTSTVIMTEENGTHTLILNNVTLEQSGEISCEARNSVGYKKYNATLSVKQTGEAPTFACNLEDRLVDEGSSLHMEAKLNLTKPKPTITWFSDGKKLSDSRFVTKMNDDGVLSLDIAETKLSDKSRITIKAENSFGIAECSASIGVKKKRALAKPAFLSDIAPICLKEGDTLETNIIITGDPPPFAKWYINNKLVVETEDTEMKSEKGVYSLKIYGASRDMTGTIKCTAYNRMGEITTEGKIEVVSPVPVEFESTLCDATCREGDTLKLKAVLLGEPTPDVTWYINGQKLEESQNVKIHAEKGTYTVTIKDITIAYSGKVICEAVNEYGRASSEAMLVVLPRGEPPDFIEWLSNIKARPGSQVTHKVVFTGDPKPVLTWYINGEEVHNSEEISIFTDQTTSTLIIKSFQAEKHIGEIICRAENEAGEVSCTASMGVYTTEMYSESNSEAMAEELQDFSDQGTENEESLAESLQIRTPTPIMVPKFITKLRDTRIKKGSQAIFECVVPDSKGVCCKWLKDGKEIELIARIRVQTRTIEGFTTSELIIDDVSLEDAGVYSVIVENTVGTESCQANLYVVEEIEKPESRAPEFTIALRDKRVQAGEKVVFECKVTGEPQPKIRWLHEEMAVEEMTKKVKIESSGDVQRLIISATEFDDHGKYSCIAENEAGISRSEATLSIHAEAPQFVRHIADKEIAVGQKLILECTVSGLPKPVVQFYREQTRLVSNSHVSVEHDQANVHWRLVIKETVDEDFASYTAVATNAVGTTESQAEVKQKQEYERKESSDSTSVEFPRFTEEPSGVTVQESEKVEFSAVVTGRPEPKVEWYKNGNLVVIDNSRITTKMEEGRHTLVIAEAKTDDIGVYSCKATNKVGSLEVAAKLGVEKCEQPVFTETLSALQVHENETARLSVTVEGKPQPVVQWLKDGFPVNIDNENVFTKVDENGKNELVIKEARISDAGIYSCIAVNKVGSSETSANFAVEEIFEAPQFTQELVKTICTPGDEAVLTVTVEGRPTPKVEWFKDGTPVNIDNVSIFSKKNDNGQHTLIIKHARKEDAGQYTCKAGNDVGTSETKCHFAVEITEQVPTFDEELEDFMVKEGENAEMSVVVKGVPTPTVQWLKNNVPICIDNKHFVEIIESEGKHTLKVHNASMEDAGSYACKAENKAGVNKIEVNFAVEETTEAPSFVEKVEDMSVPKNEDAVFSVVVSGKPQPEVEWLCNGVPINIDGVHYLERKNGIGHHELIIKQSQMEDGGVYTCKATNSVGTEETAIKFAIEELLTAPHFIQQLDEISVTDGSDAVLKVTVEGNPAPEVTWMKDGHAVNIDNVHFISKQNEHGCYSLIIKEANKQDIGTYNCKASNAAGSAELAIKFAIEDLLVAPQFTEELHELSVKAGETATLEVTVEGSPLPTVTWYKQDSPVCIDDSHFIEKKDENGHYSLTIHEATTADVGVYSCKATNAAGSTECSTKFAVQEMLQAPEFTQELEEMTVADGEDAVLSVVVHGKPEPEVKWLKSGVPVEIDGIHTIANEVNGQCTLTIKSAQSVDAGMYSCEAVNKLGSAKAEIKFAVSEKLIAPEFLEKLTDISVQETDSATIAVTVAGKPEPVIQWYKDDVAVNIDNTHIISKAGENGRHELIINEVREDDAGTYSCKAVNKAGSEVVAMHFAVEEAVVPPHFIEQLQEVSVEEAEQAVLKVVVDGIPEPKITWLKNGAPINIDNVHIFVKDNEHGEHSLIVNEVNVEDLGEYTCTAVNTAGQEECTAELKFPKYRFERVNEEEAKPMFIQPIQTVKAESDQTKVTMMCQVNEESQPEVHWYHDGQMVTADKDNFSVEMLEHGVMKLTIMNATSEDIGRYTCEAVNKFGKASTATQLTETFAAVTEEITPFESVLGFVNPLQDAVVKKGVPLEMECKLDFTAEKVSVNWLKDGGKLPIEAKVVSLDDGVQKMMIAKAKPEHAGLYRCVAAVNDTSVSTEAKITISGSPEFTQPLKSCSISETGEAVLKCKVEGNPRPKVTWKKNGKEVEKSKRITIESYDDGTNIMKIEGATEEDCGEYRCEAVNEYGSAWTEGPIDFAQECKEGEAPDFLEPVKPVVVMEGETAVLVGKLSGTPAPTVEWYRGEQKLTDDNERIFIESFEDGTQRLLIRNVQQSDADEYRCFATNEYGDVFSDVTINVQEAELAPDFLADLQAVQATEGEAIKFECRVSGQPLPEVKWYRDGVELKQKPGIKMESLPDGTNRLIIDSVHVDDQGNYRCEATNSSGSMSSKAPLNVCAIERLKILKNLSDITVGPKQKIILKIEVEGQPKTVKWFKGKEEVLSDRRTKVQKLSDQEYLLEIEKAERSDGGTYRVVLSTESESLESSSVVSVANELKFNQSLNDTSVQEGSTLELEVQIDGKVGKIDWYKDGTLIESSRAKKEELANGRYRLTISDFASDDVGKYTVKVANEYEANETSANIDIKLAAPEFVSKPSSITVAKHDDIVIEFATKGTVKGVKWYKNGSEVTNGKIEELDEGKYKLYKRKASLTDDADYKVVLFNKDSEAEALLHITVKPVLEIVKTLEDVTVDEGQKAVLEIETNSAPDEVVWYKNGEEVQKSDNIKAEVVGTACRLTVKHAADEDTADYKVVAESKGTSAMSSCSLVVKVPAISILKQLENKTSCVGDKVVLEIQTNTIPKRVKWYKNGKEIKENEHSKPQKINDNCYQLILDNVSADDTAEYKVEVSTDRNTADSSCSLTVKPMDIKFEEALKDVKAMEGNKIILSIKVSLAPKSVKWYKANTELAESDSVLLKKVDDKKYEVVIPWAKVGDAAEYKVAVYGDEDCIESTCKVEVTEKQVEVVSGLKDQEVEEGSPVTLTVKVDKKPKITKWYKNGKELSSNALVQVIKVDDFTYELKIPKAAKDDTAEYTFTVGNTDDDTVETSCSLTVKLPTLVFEKELINTSAPEGEKVVLTAEVNSAPKQVKWYKNGKEISLNNHVKPKEVSDKVFQLEISKCLNEDTATYKIVVSNDDSSADSSCKLTVVQKPKIVKGIQDQVIPVGDTLSIPIETKGRLRSVKFYKNGKAITASADKRIQEIKVDEDNYVLRIEKATEDDSGKYKVEIENEAGTAESSGEITVEPQISFLKPLKDIEVTEEQSAEFTVESNCKPRTIKWYRNGREVKPGTERVLLKSANNKFSLVINKTAIDDTAEYKVILTNSSGSIESSAKLVVKKKPVMPSIIKGLENMVIPKGSKLVLEVKFAGGPFVVRWLKDGTPVTQAANIIIEKVDEECYRLTIPNAAVTDADSYTAEAANDIGAVKTTGQVEVDVKPKILKNLENAEVSEGDKHVFTVETTTPVRTVKWYKNGREIKDTPNSKQKQLSPTKYELSIAEASDNDTAVFKVVLSNAAGECDSSASLTVKKKNVLRIVKGLIDQNLTENDELKLSVQVEGRPKKVKWYKNGQELKADAQMLIKENWDAGEFTLAIEKSSTQDSGTYRVVLSNENGEVHSDGHIFVRAKKMEPLTSAPIFVTQLTDVEVYEGDIIALKCLVNGEPKPEVTWEKDGMQVAADSRIVQRMALDGTATYRVLDAKKMDAGSYAIIAKNVAGEARSECKVNVLSADLIPTEPKFIIPLKAVTGEIGGKAEFRVKVRGVSKPQLQWYLNGKELLANDEIAIDDMGDGNWTLTIKDVKREHAGRITCIASNEKGKAECEERFTVREIKPGKTSDEINYPPRFNVPLWDRKILEGKSTSIECHVDAKPTAEIKWYKDGVEMASTEHVTFQNLSDGACRVYYSTFQRSDAGMYKCVATNTLGSAQTVATMSVEVEEFEENISEKVYPPRFNPPLMDKIGKTGDKIVLSCRVSSAPAAKISWFKDGLPLKTDKRIVAEVDNEGNCSLTISEANETDGGAYRCVASNEHGTTNTVCLLTVKRPKEEIKREGEEPMFTKGLVDKWIDRGASLMLNCVVTGTPTPEIKWYRNGILLRQTDRTKMETLSDGTCTLTVNECTMSDEGIYRCEAENKLGRAKTQCTAHVQLTFGKTEERKLEEGSAPKFVCPLEDMTVTVGSSIDLMCKVVGSPAPNIKWSKDGVPLPDDIRYNWEIDSSSGTYRLKISKSTLYDEGTYRCVASNSFGSATTKAFVRIEDTVKPKTVSSSETALPPRFTISLADARAIEGGELKFECKVDGIPLPDLVWYQNGEKLTASDRIKMGINENNVAWLTISSCTMEDDGIYRVIATNSTGSAHDKATGTVKKALGDLHSKSPATEQYNANRAPKVVVPLESVKTTEKSSFSLRCKFSGEPKPTIKWFKDGERIYAYGQCSILETEDNFCELNVKQAASYDAGSYRCMAENVYGNARTVCEVTVQPAERKPVVNWENIIKEGKAPGFSTPLTMKRAKPGETVVMECVPYGKPFPEIKWLKDGIEIEENSNIKIEGDELGAQRIIIKNVTFGSEGHYRCVAKNEYGTASTKDELRVEGPRKISLKHLEESEEPEEKKPRIRRGLYNMNIHQGSNIEIQVCTSGWPTPSVKWFKNGEELLPDNHRLIWTDERGIHRCVIVNSLPEDEGEYSLEATNKLGSAVTEGFISIIKPRDAETSGRDDRSGVSYPPGFIRQLKNKHVFSHMPTIFDCLIVGNPQPEVEWYHNGKKIVPSGRIRIQACGGGSHAIIILDTLPEDAGEYVCVARNSQGNASSSAVLDVTVPHLDEIKFNGSVDVTPYLTEEYGFRKLNFGSFPTPPDRGPFIKEVTGHHLTLSWIPTKRAPPRYPQVTYVIEIRELPEKEWTLLDYNIPEPVCKVRNLQLGKSYQFRVRAENIYGISDPSPASPPSRLMAPPQPVLDKNKRVIPLLDPYAEKALDQAYAEQYACAPWFTPGVVEKRFCAENDTMAITLHVAGYPDPEIVWKFRGWDLDTNDPLSKAHITTCGGTDTTLTISGFSKDNVGQYQCVAKNQYGEAQQNVFVDMAARPSFLQPLENKVVSNAHPLRLDVRVEGNPFPELKWMKEWRPIVESSRVRFMQDGPFLCSLIIEDPIWRDCGIYSVTATNEAGTATTSCSVTVEAEGDYNDVQLPKRVITLESKKVREIYKIDEKDEK